MTSKSSRAQYAAAAILLFGIPLLFGVEVRDFSDSRVELDYGGTASLVKTSWWGLKVNRRPLRLQNHAKWKRGLPHIELEGLTECEWFIQDQDGKWAPFEPYDPWGE